MEGISALNVVACVVINEPNEEYSTKYDIDRCIVQIGLTSPMPYYIKKNETVESVYEKIETSPYGEYTPMILYSKQHTLEILELIARTSKHNTGWRRYYEEAEKILDNVIARLTT